MTEEFYDFLDSGGGSATYLTYLNWKAASGSGGGFFETRSRPDADGERDNVTIPIPKKKGLVFYIDGLTMQVGYRRYDDKWIDWGWVTYGRDPDLVKPPAVEFAKTKSLGGVQIPDPPKQAVRMRVFCADWAPDQDVDQILEWTSNQISVLREPSYRRILATWRDLTEADKVGNALLVRLIKSEPVGRNKNNAPIFDEKIAIKPRPQAFADYEEESGDLTATPMPATRSTSTPEPAQVVVDEPEDDWAA
jgi:hypothetical protein